MGMTFTATVGATGSDVSAPGPSMANFDLTDFPAPFLREIEQHFRDAPWSEAQVALRWDGFRVVVDPNASDGNCAEALKTILPGDRVTIEAHR